MATETPVRFGILGCATIAQKLCRAIDLSPNSVLHAVGSRSYDKARKFVAENDLPPSVKIYGSYEALLDDPEVDALYMPLPTGLHLQWAVLAAKKKKHLLLEKPVAMNLAEFDQIANACEANGVQFMDGTMWMHHPRTAVMKEFLSDEKRFGHPKTVHSFASWGGDDDFFKNDIRVKQGLDGLGALGDAGWYCIRAILWAVNYELPKTVTALRGLVCNEAGVIMACGSSLQWEDGKTATFHCSFLSNVAMETIAFGTTGNLQVHDFVVPFLEKSASFLAFPNNRITEMCTGQFAMPSLHTVTTDCPQEACMVREFSRLVKCTKECGSKPENEWPSISRKTQLVLDAVKASIEKGFEPIQVGA